MEKRCRLTKNLALQALIFSAIMILGQRTMSGQEYHGGITPPVYKGGNVAMKEFIDKNVIFPDSLKTAGISGTVIVSYLINKEGQVENVKLVRGIHPVCDSEAVRVTRLLSGWQAALNWGKPISIHVIMPFNFISKIKHGDKSSVTVCGIVTDKSTGRPIEGTLIVVKGTSIGTITDYTGSYKLEIPDANNDLEFSSNGYTTKSEHIGNNSTINTELDTEYYNVDYN